MFKTEKRRLQTMPLPIFITVFLILFCFYSGAVTHAAVEKQTHPLCLVSVGVGDPDLITLRAIDTIKKADVIICRQRMRDKFKVYLDGKEILDGSMSGWRTYDQNCDGIKSEEQKSLCEQNADSREKLIAQIRAAVDAGKTIAVLGSGDLLIYGGPYRWYQQEFKDIGLKFVPGVSCFNAANAALGKDIMLGKETKATVLTTIRDIEKLSKSHPTMVIFTMHTPFEKLVEKLKTLYPLDTPVAIVFYAGSREKEQIVSGSLDTILEKTGAETFPFEHLVYVGDFLK